MKTSIYLLLLCLFFSVGCDLGLAWQWDPVDRYLEKVDLLDEKNSPLLDGPYEFVDSISPNRFRIISDNTSRDIVVRGVIPVGIAEYDLEAERCINFAILQYPYMLKEGQLQIDTTTTAALVYRPANQVHVAWVEGGMAKMDVLTYTIPAMNMIGHGYGRVDHSDTNHPHYNLYAEAERMAKKHKKGYWKDHRE